MKKGVTFYGKCENGKFERQSFLLECIAKYSGQQIEINVRKFEKRRSLNQLRFYWGVVIVMVKDFFDASGYSISTEEVHCFLKEHIAGMVKVITMPDGSRKSIVETSTKLTTVEWEDYIEKIRVWAAEWGLDIPEPTPQNMDNYLFN